jgi:hypothetical protein
MEDEIRHEVLIGHTASDHVSIRVLGRLHADASDYWDGNWLVTPIEIVAGAFEGQIGASLRVEELRGFREAIQRLNISLRGEALLESMETWLTLRITIDGSGRIVASGRVIDRPGAGNELSFRIDGLDQSYLPHMINALEEIETFFPVIGAP